MRIVKLILLATIAQPFLIDKQYIYPARPARAFLNLSPQLLVRFTIANFAYNWCAKRHAPMPHQE